MTCTFCFILSFAVAISFSFCNLYFLLTFSLFLVFTLIPFNKSSSIDSSSLKASISSWILRFQAGCLWLVLFLFFYFIPHLSVIAFAVEYINSFNIVMSFGLISLMIWSSAILPILILSLFFLFLSSFRSGSCPSMFMFCLEEFLQDFNFFFFNCLLVFCYNSFIFLKSFLLLHRLIYIIYFISLSYLFYGVFYLLWS